MAQQEVETAAKPTPKKRTADQPGSTATSAPTPAASTRTGTLKPLHRAATKTVGKANKDEKSKIKESKAKESKLKSSKPKKGKTKLPSVEEIAELAYLLYEARCRNSPEADWAIAEAYLQSKS